MTRTEQLHVKFAFPSEDCMDLRPRTINGQDVPDWKNGPTLLEFLDRLRREGWHVVNGKITGAMTFERQTPHDQ